MKYARKIDVRVEVRVGEEKRRRRAEGEEKEP
jgi:hypothetical protein